MVVPRVWRPFAPLLVAGAVVAQSPAQAPAAGANGEIQGWTFALRDGARLLAKFGGATARPAAVGEFDVQALHVETFRGDGELDLVADAPACRVTLGGDGFLVTSPGPLKLAQENGRFAVESEGFRWDHAAGKLTLSNNVRTLLRLTLPAPAP
jgi:hypothetical protein